MVVLKIALGVALGAALIRWARRHHHHHHGGFRGRRMFFLARRLGLSAEQVEALRPIWLSARNAMTLLRFSQAQATHGIFAAVANADPLDRARLDGVAARHAEDQAQAGKDLTAAIAAAYEVLTPEQRDKVRAHLAGHGFCAARRFHGGEGPYRTMMV